MNWSMMKQRCGNPRAADYINYGGRGIAVCERWKNSFYAFLEDMGPPPSPGHTIDRIDNSLGYFKGNCRWADREAQNSNKRNSVKITAFGETLTRQQWCKKLGIRYGTLKHRVDVVGMSPEEAMLTPNMVGEFKRVNKIKDGVVVFTYASLKEAAAAEGVSKTSICGALKGKAKTACGYEWKYEK